MYIPKLASIIAGLAGAILITNGVSVMDIFSIIPGIVAVIISILMLIHYPKEQSVITRVNTLEDHAGMLRESLSEEPILTIRGLSLSKENLDEGCVGNLTMTLLNQSLKSITNLVIMHKITSKMQSHFAMFTSHFKTLGEFLHQGNSSVIPMFPYRFESPIYGHPTNEAKFYLYLWLTYNFNNKEYENIFEIEFLNNNGSIFGQHNNDDVLTKRKKMDELGGMVDVSEN